MKFIGYKQEVFNLNCLKYIKWHDNRIDIIFCEGAWSIHQAENKDINRLFYDILDFLRGSNNQKMYVKENENFFDIDYAICCYE